MSIQSVFQFMMNNGLNINLDKNYIGVQIHIISTEQYQRDGYTLLFFANLSPARLELTNDS